MNKEEIVDEFDKFCDRFCAETGTIKEKLTPLVRETIFNIFKEYHLDIGDEIGDILNSNNETNDKVSQYNFQKGMVYALPNSDTITSFKKMADKFGVTVEDVTAAFEDAALWKKINEDLWINANDIYFWAMQNKMTEDEAIEFLKIKAANSISK